VEAPHDEVGPALGIAAEIVDRQHAVVLETGGEPGLGDETLALRLGPAMHALDRDRPAEGVVLGRQHLATAAGAKDLAKGVAFGRDATGLRLRHGARDLRRIHLHGAVGRRTAGRW